MHFSTPFAISALLLLAEAKKCKSTKKHSKGKSSRTSTKPAPVQVAPVQAVVPAFVSSVKGSGGYKMTDYFSGQSFLDQFTYASGPADNGGAAYYVSKGSSQGLVYVNKDDSVTLAVSNQQYQEARESVKLVSNRKFNGGLFIFDVASVPAVCGAWPALWMTGSNWPQDGEIDIIEGVHETTMNAMSTHTASGCTQQTSGFLGTFMMAGYAKNNCDAYATNSQGCGVRSTDKESLGAPFNNKGGGVFALKWDDNGVSTYHFARSNVPSDITSNDPNPGTWGTPDNFVHPDSCNPKDHFKDLMLVVNTNLCGVWGSGVWNDDMSYAGQTGSCASRTGFATCEDYVKNSGKDFSNAAWKINSMKIFQY